MRFSETPKPPREMSTSTKRKLPEWMQKYEDGDKNDLPATTSNAKKTKTSDEEDEHDIHEKNSGKDVQLLLAKARLAMSLLADEEEKENEWEYEKIATDGNDSFVAVFDLEQCSLMDSMEVEDVLEIISKIKGQSYISNYPHMHDREALMFDIDECFVKYCNMHGIRVQY